MTDLVRLYGTDEPPVRWRHLAAGALTVELDGGNLRYLRWGGVEIVRAVSFLVRDTAWGTYATALSGLAVTEVEERFEVSYRGRCEGPEGVFVYTATIVGEADGSVRFAAQGAPERDFRVNRVGFVVLHPIDGVAGREMRVEHTDGTSGSVTLPLAIAPDQPVMDIRALTHRPTPGLEVEVRMEGDAFEMEDQRNWTDASFKTYVRPLSRPRPFLVPAGQRIAQSVRVTVRGTMVEPDDVDAGAPLLSIGDAEGVVPGIGVVCGVEADTDIAARLATVAEIRPRHLICRIDVRQAADVTALREVGRLRAAGDARLTVEIVVPGIDPQSELAQAAATLAAAGIVPDAVVPSPARDLKTRPSNTLPDGEAPLGAIYAVARRIFPGAALGGGMLTSFTELNRNRPPVGGIDFITHGTAAIVHAADDVSVMETLEALPQVIGSVRALAPGLPYRLGPSSIGMRENPYGPAVSDDPDGRRVAMARRDPRQRGLFGAAWTLGYLATAARLEVAVVTLAHLDGDLGLYEASGESVRFHPLAHVLRGVARAAGATRLAASAGAGIACLAFATPAGHECWLANLTDREQRVRLPEGPRSMVARLDTLTFDAAATDLGFLDRPSDGHGDVLRPYAVVRHWSGTR